MRGCDMYVSACVWAYRPWSMENLPQRNAELESRLKHEEMVVEQLREEVGLMYVMTDAGGGGADVCDVYDD